jgi:hypothetical protein
MVHHEARLYVELCSLLLQIVILIVIVVVVVITNQDSTSSRLLTCDELSLNSVLDRRKMIAVVL